MDPKSTDVNLCPKQTNHVRHPVCRAKMENASSWYDRSMSKFCSMDLNKPALRKSLLIIVLALGLFPILCEETRNARY